MNPRTPMKVLITGGHEIGGVGSVASGLCEGFGSLGIAAEVISPAQMFWRWRELRDPNVLKILSTSALFFAPFAKRTICVAHGIPNAACQGWARLVSIIGSFRLSNMCAGTQLVAVSNYTAIHLQELFNIRIDKVIINPVKSIFLEQYKDTNQRNLITYAGRLTPSKNLHRLLPAIKLLLDEHPELRMCIIGNGEQKESLLEIVGGDPRFEFKGNVSDCCLRDCLRHTKLFVSGKPLEGLGVTYLEALSQNCAVAMPACGGGVELALDQVGKSVHLFPIAFNDEDILASLRQAMDSEFPSFAMDRYSAAAVAKAYLGVDARFSVQGLFHARRS
jgi:glycosyltransferase involved in cell wall biosynthesis